MPLAMALSMNFSADISLQTAMRHGLVADGHSIAGEWQWSTRPRRPSDLAVHRSHERALDGISCNKAGGWRPCHIPGETRTGRDGCPSGCARVERMLRLECMVLLMFREADPVELLPNTCVQLRGQPRCFPSGLMALGLNSQAGLRVSQLPVEALFPPTMRKMETAINANPRNCRTLHGSPKKYRETMATQMTPEAMLKDAIWAPE